MKFSHLRWTTNCLTKAPTHEKTFWVVGQDDPRDPQIITGHCFCAWVALVEEVKSLLLKKPWILNAESRGPELDLNWMLPPWRIAFMYHKAPWKFPKEESSQLSYPFVVPMNTSNDKLGMITPRIQWGIHISWH